jgi:hypothetical protein
MLGGIPNLEKIMAVYDTDIIYATRFMEYFKKKKDLGFGISAFTRKESLDEFLRIHQIEILILGECIRTEELPEEKIKYIFQFTEDPKLEKDTGPPNIFKYQPVQAIMAEIISFYAKKENESGIEHNTEFTKVISVISPTPNIMKLLFTWSIGVLLSERKKVLVVPLDLLPIQLLSFVDYTSQSLSEFIYYLKENPNIIMKMKTLLSYNGNLAYLTGLTHGFDLLSLTKEDICKWVEALKNHTDYQTVVFYLGYYTDSIVELMNQSDSVLIPITSTPYEKTMLKEWERQMDRIGINTSSDKFHRISIQEEELLVQAPISLQELSQSSAWIDALKYTDC